MLISKSEMLIPKSSKLFFFKLIHPAVSLSNYIIVEYNKSKNKIMICLSFVYAP